MTQFKAGLNLRSRVHSVRWGQSSSYLVIYNDNTMMSDVAYLKNSRTSLGHIRFCELILDFNEK